MWFLWIFLLVPIYHSYAPGGFLALLLLLGEDVDSEDVLPSTPFPENPLQLPKFAHLCGQCGIGTWYLYIVAQQDSR